MLCISDAPYITYINMIVAKKKIYGEDSLSNWVFCMLLRAPFIYLSLMFPPLSNSSLFSASASVFIMDYYFDVKVQCDSCAFTHEVLSFAVLSQVWLRNATYTSSHLYFVIVCNIFFLFWGRSSLNFTPCLHIIFICCVYVC